MFSPAQLLQLRQIVAEEAKEALLRHQNHRSLFIYGLPEGEAMTQVHSILALCNIPKEYICVRHRLGNPNLVRNRPLRVDLREGIPMPSLRDLARKLSDDTSMRSFHVRLLETPRQRQQGYQKREARRQAKIAVTAPQVPIAATKTHQVLDFSPISHVDFHEPPVITISSSQNVIVDTLDTAISPSNDTIDEVDPVLPCCLENEEHHANPHPVGSVLFHVDHLYNCIEKDAIGDKYKYFNNIPVNMQASVSHRYFELCQFRLYW